MSYDGVAPGDLAARLGAPSCLSLVTVTSTLDVLHDLAAEGAPAGSVVLAEEQIAGRGRQGRSWHSPAGAGIWMSYLARPTRGLDTGALAIRVGLAVADAAEDLGVMVGLKWPNDVLLWDRKLAGILCEARWQRDRLAWVAIGIGINVHGPVPAPLAGRAVALSEALPSVNRLGLLERLVPRLATMPDAAHLDRDELARYRRRDWLFDRCLAEPVRGMAQGVDASGALLVQTARGLERVVGGSVTCC